MLSDVLSQVAAASRNPMDMLDVAARLLTEHLGDGANIRIVSPDGRVLLPGAARHRKPHAEELSRRLIAESPQGVDEGVGGQVIATGTPYLARHMPPDGQPVAERYRQYIDEVGYGSLIVVPLRSRGRVLGVLTVARDRGSAPYADEDLRFAVEVGERVGLLFDNARLAERDRMHAAMLAHVDAAVVATDLDERITVWNEAAQRLFGWEPHEALGHSTRELLLAAPLPDHDAVRDRVVDEGSAGGRLRLRTREGATFLADVQTSTVRDEAGEPSGFVSVITDLTERLALIDQLQGRAAQQSAVAALGERALESEDPGALLDHAVEVVRDTLGVDLAAMLELEPGGRTFMIRAGVGFEPGIVRSASVPAGWHDTQAGFTFTSREPVITDDAITERRFARSEILARHGIRSGVTVVVQGRGGPHGILGAYSRDVAAFSPDEVTFLQSVANVLGDALDRWSAEMETLRRSLHDALTGLPNRSLVLDRLGHALERAGRSAGGVALLFLDVDHFKHVNDSFGHGAGDELLIQVADRLRHAVRPADTVGRFGGDEFVVLCEDVLDETMAMAIAARLAAVFAQPFALGGDEHHVGASIGIVLRQGEEDAEALLRDADAAMYRAKERGRGRVELFDAGMRDRAEGRVRVETGLRRGIDAGELEVHYQPIADLGSGCVAAVEALVRWRHPERGLLAPSEFIPVAEDTGLIVPLGRRVLEVACLQAAAWTQERAGRPTVPVHVNLAPRQLQDQALVETVAATLAATGAPPEALVLEVTESSLVERGGMREHTLERLRDLGVGLALDDFGTGWSSLAYLARLPITGLKVDRSFVAGMEQGLAPITDAIVRMAFALGLDVVAEGIETEEQLRAVRRLGCGLGQGFLLARPLPAAEATELVVAAEPPFVR
ncbi:MAG: EAL domain-containing protein [Solirubrobacterales bacterium]|nr:EAL domain-containing protein [Solirubrobacterales bacterium]